MPFEETSRRWRPAVVVLKRTGTSLRPPPNVRLFAQRSPLHRNRPLPELRLIKLSVDQHRRSAAGDLPRFREHGRGVLGLLEKETPTAVAFGDFVVVRSC